MNTGWSMQCPVTVSSDDIGFQIPDSISVRLGAEQGIIKFSIKLENEYDAEYIVGQALRYYPNSEAQSFINEFLSLFDQSMICFDEADRVHYRMYTDHIRAAPYGRYEVGYLCRRSLDFLYPQRTALPRFLSGFNMERTDTSLTQDGTTLSYIRLASSNLVQEAKRISDEFDALAYAAGNIRIMSGAQEELPDKISDDLDGFLNSFRRKFDEYVKENC